MKTRTFSFLVMLVITGSFPLMAQDWRIGGNALSGTGSLGSTNNYSMTFKTNNTERGRLTSGGLWGFGSNNPSAKVHINTVSGQDALRVQVNNSTKLYVQSGGGVSIGSATAAPFNGMYVNGTVGMGTDPGGYRLKVGQPGIFGFDIQNLNTQDDWELWIPDNGTLSLYRNGTPAGFFDTDGSYFSVSDGRLKTNIQAMPSMLGKIGQLKPATYQFKSGGGRLAAGSTGQAGVLKYGFIAQEVKEIFPNLVKHTQNKQGGGETYTLDYSGFGVLAIKGIQELQGVIGAQQQTIQAQQQTINALEARLTRLEAATAAGTAGRLGVSRAPGLGDVSLEQNHPNPFNQATTIRYRVPAGATAEILIRDVATGVLVKQLPASARGQVQLNANELRAGTYVYSLSVNGQVVASETMILLK